MKVVCHSCGHENLITNLDPDEVHHCVDCKAVLKKLPYAVPVDDDATRPLATPGREFCDCKFPIPDGAACLKCRRWMVKLA